MVLVDEKDCMNLSVNIDTLYVTDENARLVVVLI